MGGVAKLAQSRGVEVTGSDANVYPPMSTQLSDAGIEVREGYRARHLDPPPDRVIVGNALSRGNEAVEHMLNTGLAYTSGPQWLAEEVLDDRRVLAVAGTHGKTTTAAMLAWILAYRDRRPGFLIGGVPSNFNTSVRAGEGRDFVVEADEYDSAFFDKRSKFVHYRPRIAILNNLEYDHADIFPHLAAIQRQFHHFVRTIPGEGTIIVNGDDPALADVLEMGCWSRVETFSADDADAHWHLSPVAGSATDFHVRCRGRHAGTVRWDVPGRHNALNALAAVAAARAAGVAVDRACEALSTFAGVARRLERFGPLGGVTVYDDFAHHPTAVRATLEALRALARDQRVVVALEPRSNSMRAGVHAAGLAPALQSADRVYLVARPEWGWNPRRVTAQLNDGVVVGDTDALFARLCADVRPGDHVVFMSNGGFGGIRQRFVSWLEEREST